MKKLCVSNTWFKREKKRKVTCGMGGYETKIDFMLICPWFMQNVKAMPFSMHQYR